MRKNDRQSPRTDDEQNGVAVPRPVARAQLQQTRRPGWLDKARTQDIAQAWQSATTWAAVDPQIANDRDQIRDEVRRRHGADVEDLVARERAARVEEVATGAGLQAGDVVDRADALAEGRHAEQVADVNQAQPAAMAARSPQQAPARTVRTNGPLTVVAAATHHHRRVRGIVPRWVYSLRDHSD